MAGSPFGKLTPESFKAQIHAGWTVFDLGAGTGGMTEAALQAGAHVIAVEPARKQANQIRADFPEAEVLDCAIAATHGTAAFYLGDPKQGTLYPAKQRNPVVVMTLTIDELATHSPPDLVKCDLQGGEAAAFRGATSTLETIRPTWVIEVWPRGLEYAGDSVDSLIALLEPHVRPLSQTQQPVTWDDVREAAAHKAGGGGYFDLWMEPL